MDDFKLCSDGEFMPVSFPCPPPYSGPYYYYPYENIPLPPEQGITDYPVSSSKPLSSGAVAAIIIIVGFIFFIMCLIALKFRTRFILSNRVSRRDNIELSGEFLVHNGDMVNVVGCGLEEKLVNLLPVCEYVGLMKEGKVDGKERHECAVCLSSFEEKEIVRVLPKCHHIFHLQCIDKWFESHANCPLCREKITLQTIQLSFNPDKQNNDDQQPPINDFSHQHLNDQHVNSPPLRDSYLHNLNNQQDGSLACELQDPDPLQNIVAAAASATSIIYPHPAQASDQPHHLIVDDRKRKAAGSACNFEDLCSDQTTISIPAATADSMKYEYDAGSKVDKNESNTSAAIRDAYCIYIGIDQSAGPVCAPYDHQNPSDLSHGAADDRRTARSRRESNNIGYFVNPNKSQEDHAGHIDDHKLLLPMTSSTYNPSTRSSSLLRKSLSTGSLFESDAKASHAFHGTTREML